MARSRSAASTKVSTRVMSRSTVSLPERRHVSSIASAIGSASLASASDRSVACRAPSASRRAPRDRRAERCREYRTGPACWAWKRAEARSSPCRLAAVPLLPNRRRRGACRSGAHRQCRAQAPRPLARAGSAEEADNARQQNRSRAAEGSCPIGSIDHGQKLGQRGSAVKDIGSFAAREDPSPAAPCNGGWSY